MVTEEMLFFDSVPAGSVLCPLWLPQLGAFDDPANHGGGCDEKVSSSLEESGGDTQSFSVT